MRYKCGAAAICATPLEPLWLAGYAVRTAPGQGKLNDLYASAVALEDECGRRLVIASLDLIAVTPAISDRVVEAARDRHQLAPEQVVLTATHTHYGPEFRPDKQRFFNIPAEYAAKLSGVGESMATALIAAIDDAVGRLEPVRLVARKATANFAHNRRRHGVKEGTPSNLDIVDHTVHVLECIDAAGQRKAILFGYACHNTTIPPDDLRYSSDWAGFAKQQLARNNPGATLLFMPGAGADQDPEPRGSVELSRRHGQEIADAVQKSFHGPGTEISGPLRFAEARVALPFHRPTSVQLREMLASEDAPRRKKGQYLQDALQWGVQLIESYEAPLQVVRLGNELLIVALSGEPVVDWAHKFEHRFESRGDAEPTSRVDCSHVSPRLVHRFPHVWVAGYCNDVFGYLPTHRVQIEGGYEAGRANLWSSLPGPFTEDVEHRVSVVLQRLIDKVSNE